MTTKDAIQTLIMSCGMSGNDTAKVVAEVIKASHPSLQQGAMQNIVFPIIRELAHQYREGWTDVRNVMAGEVARQMEPNIKHLPFM